MRVVHLACLAPPEIGGIGSVAAEEVRRLYERGVDAQVFVPKPHVVIDTQRDERDQIVRLPAWRFGNAAWMRHVRSLTDRADIIHLHYPFYGTAERLLLGLRPRVPIVMTFHMDACAAGWKGWIFDLHRRWIQPRLLSHAQRIFVSSLDYARHSSLSSFLTVHPERVVELPFGVDLERFALGAGERSHLGLPERVPLVLFVGGLDRAHAFKGLEVLLSSLTRMRSDVHLAVSGDGDLRSSYEAQAARLNLAGRVHFLGRVSDDELPALYRSADVFAFPSLHRAEAFGLVALNAQASGVPVVASALPGVRTVILDQETGILVPPGDAATLAAALDKVLGDAALRAKMGKEARGRAERLYRWDAHVDGLMQVYEQITQAYASGVTHERVSS